MHGETRTWNHPRPAMGESRPKAEERHDRSRGPTPGEVSAKVKGHGTWITRSLDKVGPAKMGKIMWPELCRLEPFCISFLLRSVNDTLPTPTMREDPLCRLCGGRGTLAHILVRCKTALSQGRYRWCHDKVFRVLADILEQVTEKASHPHETSSIYPPHQ